MARVRIGILSGSGCISSIYCHNGSGPGSMGRLLEDVYNNSDHVQDLLALGDISYLGRDLLETVAYHRDRGEPLRGPLLSKNAYDYVQDLTAEYHYLFTLVDGWVLVARDGTLLKRVQ